MTNIVCVTIIIVTFVAAICICLYRYITCVYNPTSNKNDDKIKAINIIVNNMLNRYYLYENAKDNEKYNFTINTEEIKNAFINIAQITKEE